MRPVRFALVACALAAYSVYQAPALAGGGEKAAKPRLLAEYTLQGARSPALDVRWATDHSIFLTTTLDQVAEHRLETGLPVIRQLYPKPLQLDPFMTYWHLGVSDETLVVAAPARRISWRPVAPNPGGPVLYERRMLGGIDDLDLQGDRLAWIGWPDSINDGVSSDLGGVAWIDRLADHLETPQRLLSDLSGTRPGQHLADCQALEIGALRFQPDGSLLVAPGFLDDIALLDPAGNPLRHWDARWFGVDTSQACPKITPAERQRLNLEPLAVQEWGNRHRVIDEALATPQGPALVVRRLVNGLPAWQLHVLGAARVESFDLPIRVTSPFARLAGDVRGSRLVLLISDSTAYPRAGAAPDRVLVVGLP